MPEDQPSSPQHWQPSEEQERQLVEWVRKERASGTIVRNELINWFAERLLRRDGSAGHEITPGFADEFLHRHPDLARKLAAPSPPERDGPNYKRETHTGPGGRLRALMEQDHTRALFGDSPPPPRLPADFPDGDIIYHCHNRYIVRHGSTVTKLTTYPHGMGSNDHPNEAEALRFIKANTTIPVPEVISSDWDRITMQYVEGQTLQQAWPVLTPDQQSDVLAQLSDYIAQLRALRGIHIGRLDGQGVVVPSRMTRSGGPFCTVSELHDWLVKPPRRLEQQSMYWHQITTQLGTDYPIVFTHGDIAARNIMIRDGRIVAIMDWEFAGWYPEYWDYVFTMRGLDKIDWETLGKHLPLLFAKRHDLEYILMQFIIDLS
ncbi:hypothetical protein SLS64_009062 [Diaporthe eres]|uniref:non-specific serine/threonine protein kinase n=1 Tax=Diaporthe eres TaxID=83184 RepID=A0ABR1NUC8_DIAER